MRDLDKIISGNVIKEGGATSCDPTCAVSTLSTLGSVHYGATPDIDARAAVFSRHGKIRGYYYQSDNPYSPDVATDTVTSGANAIAAILYSADAYGGHVIDGLGWSYSAGAPVGGSVTVQTPSGTTVYTADIAGSGAGYIDFPDSIRGSGNTNMYIVLAAGGGSVVGKLDVFGHRVE